MGGTLTDNWVSCHIFRIKRWFYTKNMNFHCKGVKLKAGGGGSSHSPPRGYFWWVQVAFWQLRRRRLSLTAHGRCVPLRGVQRPNSLEYQTSTPLPFDTLVTGLAWRACICPFPASARRAGRVSGIAVAASVSLFLALLRSLC